MDFEGYGGFTNYPTLCFSLWECGVYEADYEHLVQLAKESKDVKELAGKIKSYASEKFLNDIEISLQRNLLSYALDQINYEEIAGDILTELEA